MKSRVGTTAEGAPVTEPVADFIRFARAAVCSLKEASSCSIVF